MTEADVHRRLATQGLRRPLTPEEESLAAALEEIFASGEHDFARVVERLNERRIVRPSAVADPWTPASLTQELERINRALDEAYAAAPLIAPYR